MNSLNDKEIRTALKAHIVKHRPKSIIDELRVDESRSVADVVAVFRQAHCYEIKGQNDNLDRLCSQIPNFSRSFPKVTLVTTENHVEKAKNSIPTYWGLMLAKTKSEHPENPTVKLVHIRKSKTSPLFCKLTALHTLWKKELLQIVSNELPNPGSINRNSLVIKISEQLSKETTARRIADALFTRTQNLVKY